MQSWGWNAAWADRFAAHAGGDCTPGRITVEHRGLYHFQAAGGEGTAQVSGRLRHLAGERADFPAVGDWVALRLASGDGPAVIESVLPRINKLSRQAPGDAVAEQILAANLDVLFLVTSLNRDLNPRRLERFLAAAALPRCELVVVLTKSDLCDSPASVVDDCRRRLGVGVHAVSALAGVGLDELTPYLSPGRTVALLGSSGVGKSTLLNRLAGQSLQPVAPIREYDDRGRHTTTHRELVQLPTGALLIDSPGLRELQLWADGADVDAAFADIAELASGCAFGDCSHTHEPRCAVQQAIADGRLDEGRYASYCKLQKEMQYQEARADPRAARERKEHAQRIHRIFGRQQRKRKDN